MVRLSNHDRVQTPLKERLSNHLCFAAWLLRPTFESLRTSGLVQ